VDPTALNVNANNSHPSIQHPQEIIHHHRYSSRLSVAANLFHPAGSSNGRMTRPEFCRSDENPTATPDTLTAPSTTRVPLPARSPVLPAPYIAASSGHHPPLHRVIPPITAQTPQPQRPPPAQTPQPQRPPPAQAPGPCKGFLTGR
jgi:hypothetical protein